MGFDGKCSGGGLGEVWGANIATKPVVKADEKGRFAATLTGTMRRLGGIDGRVGSFTWRLSGRFTAEDVAVATVTGSAKVTSGKKVISRCRIAGMPSVRLAVRSH
jgi:hypothetical protein